MFSKLTKSQTFINFEISNFCQFRNINSKPRKDLSEATNREHNKKVAVLKIEIKNVENSV